MKQKFISIIVIALTAILCLNVNLVIAQKSDDYIPGIVLVKFESEKLARLPGETRSLNSNTRTVSVYSGVGFLEFFVVGVQYQINKRFSVGVKTNAVFLGSSSVLPSGGIGVGIKSSYYFDETGKDYFLGFNAANFEASYLGFRSGSDQFAAGFEATLGHDSIEGYGLGLIWALGIAYSVSANDPALFFPALKFGIHLDM